MRKSILVLPALFLFLSAFCQDPKIKWGDEFKLHRGSTDLSVIYSDNSGVYLQEDHLALKTSWINTERYQWRQEFIKFWVKAGTIPPGKEKCLFEKDI